MTSDSQYLSSKERVILSMILLSIAILIALDILSDAKEGASFSHMAVEGIAGLAAVIGSGLLLGKSMQAGSVLKKTQEKLEKSREEAAYWKANSRLFIEGLSKAIDEQFQKWNFSPSEKEVALLFLKGLSSKEVAEIRGVADKTIRAQATTIYEKSGLAGRAELSAFFLEDLLAPHKEL